MRSTTATIAVNAVLVLGALATAAAAWEYRLVDASSNTNVNSGRLEARATSSDPWGTVCDDSWDAACFGGEDLCM